MTEKEERIYAYTSDEILERLPSCVEIQSVLYLLEIAQPDKYCVVLGNEKATFDEKLSNALAKMWIWLIENKYMEA